MELALVLTLITVQHPDYNSGESLMEDYPVLQINYLLTTSKKHWCDAGDTAYFEEILQLFYKASCHSTIINISTGEKQTVML